jgi:uncharacterized membrane protein
MTAIGGDRRVRTGIMAAFIANMALTALMLIILPENVASHFGGNGTPNAWVSRESIALIFLATEVPLFLLVYYAPSLVFQFPPGLINLPNRDYWLREKNRPQAREKLGALMSVFGIALFSFLFVVKLLVIDANLAEPVRLNEPVFLSAFAAFMAFMVYWLLRIVRAFRIPPDAQGR